MLVIRMLKIGELNQTVVELSKASVCHWLCQCLHEFINRSIPHWQSQWHPSSVGRRNFETEVAHLGQASNSLADDRRVAIDQPLLLRGSVPDDRNCRVSGRMSKRSETIVRV